MPRGPIPTPKKVLQLRGSHRANDRGDEPAPDPSLPEMPAWLNEPAKKLWEWLLPQLVFMGLIGQCDREAIARYCQLVARYQEAEAFITEYGSTYVITGGPSAGQIRQYPQVSYALKLSDQILRLDRHFGLTPGARAGLALGGEGGKGKTGKERFFDAG